MQESKGQAHDLDLTNGFCLDKKKMVHGKTGDAETKQHTAVNVLAHHPKPQACTYGVRNRDGRDRELGSALDGKQAADTESGNRRNGARQGANRDDHQQSKSESHHRHEAREISCRECQIRASASPPKAVNTTTNQGGNLQNIKSAKATNPSPKSAAE